MTKCSTLSLKVVTMEREIKSIPESPPKKGMEVKAKVKSYIFNSKS